MWDCRSATATHAVLIAVTLVLASSTLGPVQATPRAAGPTANAAAPGVVPVNGPAYRAVPGPGADYQVERLVPVAAGNPDRETWLASRRLRQRFASEGATPVNVQASRDGRVEGASNRVTDFSEVMVVLDPTDDSHLLACSKFFYRPSGYDFYTGVLESYDAGATWSQVQPDGVENYSLTSDPVTAFDEKGNGYFTLLTRGPHQGASGLDMLKKPRGGRWQQPVVVDTTTRTDKQWITADQDPQGTSPYPGNVYMSWTALALRSRPARIMVSRSITRNASWSLPLEVASDNDVGGVQGSIPGVGPDGTVYVLYGRGIFGGPATGRLEVVASTDGGRTFGKPVLAAEITSIPFFLPNGLPDLNFRTPASLPAFAVSPVNGDLYAAWSDYRHDDADIFIARSSDKGQSWTEPLRLNDDPVGSGVDQFQPQVSIAPSGRVAVMWFDRRLSCPDLPWVAPEHVGQENACIDVFMTRSTDDGAAWEPNLRVSAQTWDWRLNLPIADPNAGGGIQVGFIGDYQGIASSNEADYPLWNSTANLGHNADNHQQVFVARVPVGWQPPTSVPSPTASASPTPSPSASTSASPSPSASQTSSPTGSPSVSPTPSAPSSPTHTTASPTAQTTPDCRIYVPRADKMPP